MRVTIQFDSATTDQVRDLAAACAVVTGKGLESVKCNGPEHWAGSSPHLTPNQFAMVVGRIVKLNGAPLIEAMPFASLVTS